MARITFEGNFCDISMCRESPCPYNGMCSQRETWERLKKYEDAEQDGRLVVLPCKVGDKVRVDARTWGDTWNYKTVDGGKYLLGETVSIIKTRKQTFIKIRVEHNVSWKRPMRRYPISAIGKTIFLTREEAEAAMAQEGDSEQ